MSNFFETVKDLTLKLRKRLPQKKIIWGGVHATVLPEKCIEFADYLCIGEGEISMLNLCNNLSDEKPTNTIPGIWSRQDNQIFRNAPTNFIMDLDQLPPPDYDLEDNYILVKKKNLLSLTEKNMPGFLGLTYWTMYSRGCPFSCAYCCNDAYKRIHKDLVKLRAKSPQGIVKELEAIQEKFPYIRYINFQDDTFFALPEKDIKAFSEHYQKHIQLPFLVPGLNPSVFTENKFDDLVESGLLRTRMGIQSGSSKVVEEIYKRTQDNQRIIEISKSLQKYPDKMTMPNYDIIIDNPWETKEDILKTIDLLDSLAPPFSLNIFSLEFFLGTRLYDRALKEKLFSEDRNYKPYYHYEYTYLNLIILIYAVFKIPKWLLRILLAKPFVQTNKEFEILHRIFYKLMLYRRGLCALVKRDYSMFPAKLQFFFCRILPPPAVNKKKTV
jgi:anaerobic magnesium-protoporphyrin IX monomethyl ester cyclase